MLSEEVIEHHARELYAALRQRHMVDPLLGRVEGLTLEGAYAISRRLLALRLADGERVVGRKIGITGHAVQRILGVSEPDFGWLTDRMEVGFEVPVSRFLTQPRAEAELAFVLGAPLRGPGVTPQDVLAATREVAICFEVVDSRVRDWKIRIEDTVADNASSGLFVLGNQRVDPRGMALAGCRLEVTKNGQPLTGGTGADSTPGSPEACVAWLVNRLADFGDGLEAGEVILSGALMGLEPVAPGDEMTAEIAGIGRIEVTFT